MNPLIKFIFDDYKKKKQTKSKWNFIHH
jgi:hypothetical protein